MIIIIILFLSKKQKSKCKTSSVLKGTVPNSFAKKVRLIVIHSVFEFNRATTR